MNRYTRLFVVALAVVMLPLAGSAETGSTASVRIKPWHSQQLSPVQRAALEAFHGPGLRSKAGPMHKVGYELTHLFYLDLLSPPLAAANLMANGLTSLPLRRTADSRDLVLVDATANGDAHLLELRLQQLGATDLSVAPPIVSGWIPVKALDQIAAIESLRFLRPSRAMTQTGVVTSQGDFAIRGSSLRPPTMPGGPTGSGIKVGAISDSFNCQGGAAADDANGEFPSGVTVIREEPGCVSGTDEGRAMLQLVADVAPSAPLLFASGEGGIAAFANSVTSLANSGARVIVDDLVYFASPWFQDGVINAAINASVLNKGAAYFSAAGNQSILSYESVFRPSASISGFHDFDPSPGTDRVLSSVFVGSGETVKVFMQWDQPFASACPGCPGSQSDIDIYFVSAIDASIIGTPGLNANIGDDPVEYAEFTNPGPADWFLFVIENFDGPSPGLVKLVYLNPNLSYSDITWSSTAVGPGLAANAIAVGAAEFYETPACDTSPPQLSWFSSRGGVPTLFSAMGARLAVPVVRQKPEIVAPQNGNTSFFGQDIPSQPGVSTLGECLDGDVLPNFPGTSAAAPHAAGVAALLLDAIPSLTSQQLYDGMKLSAIDMSGAGFDYDSGYGLLQADAALRQLVSVADTTLSTSTIAGCKEVTGTITLSGPAPPGGLVVSLNDTLAAASLPSSVSFLAGETAKTFAVTTTPVAAAQDGTVSVTYGGATLIESLKLRPMGVDALYLTPNPVVGGDLVTGFAKLECPAGPGSITVGLGSSNPLLASPTTPNVIVPAGTQLAKFRVRTANWIPFRTTPSVKATANGIAESGVLYVFP